MRSEELLLEDDQWEICIYNSNYIISSEFPYPIRKRCFHKENCKFKICNRNISEFYEKGYACIKLNRNKVEKHRVIALQWIENDDPENKIHVDHINRIRSDNRIENLRWVTRSENMRNCILKNSEYFQQLPKTIILLENYDGIDLDRYWFDPIEEKLYVETTMNDYPFRLVNLTHNQGYYYIILIDTNGKTHRKNWFTFLNYMRNVR